MKNLKYIFVIIIQIFSISIIFNSVNAKNFKNNYNVDDISSYFSGVLYLNDNDFENSHKFLKKLNGLEDIHTSYFKMFQYSLVNLEKFKEAYIYAKKMEKKNIASFESNLIIGIYYLKNKNYIKSSKYFQKLHKNDNSESIETLKTYISKSLNILADYPSLQRDERLELIESRKTKYTIIKKIEVTFAHCYNDSKETINKFKELTSDTKNNYTRYSFFYSNYLNKIEKFTDSENVLNKNLITNPRNYILNQLKFDISYKKKLNISNKFNCKNLSDIGAELLYIVSDILSAQSSYGASNFYLNLAKFLNPKFSSFNYLYAENFFKLKQFDKSEKIYRKLLKIENSYSWHASKQISKIILAKKKKKESLEFLKKKFQAIKNPNPYEIYDYANFLKINEKFNEAIKYYSKVLNIIDKSHSLYPATTDGRGISYERIGNWENAEKDFLNSLEASPDQAYVINYLAYTWIEMEKNTDQALSMLKKANKLRENDGYITDSLGWALFKLKRFKQANKYLQLAVMLMPSDPIINDHYGDSLWMNNNIIQARYYWNYVLNLDETKNDLKKLVKQKLIYGLDKKI